MKNEGINIFLPLAIRIRRKYPGLLIKSIHEIPFAQCISFYTSRFRTKFPWCGETRMSKRWRNVTQMSTVKNGNEVKCIMITRCQRNWYYKGGCPKYSFFFLWNLSYLTLLSIYINMPVFNALFECF